MTPKRLHKRQSIGCGMDSFDITKEECTERNCTRINLFKIMEFVAVDQTTRFPLLAQ
jgi:hypothetical protein